MGKGFFVAVSVLVALLAVTIPAQATVQDHEHYSFPFTDDDDVCGFAVHIDGTTSGNTRNRVGKGDLDTAFFGLDNYEYTARLTNTANGRFFTEWGNGSIRDVKATHVSGSVFKFTTVEAGRPYNLSDASGRVLIRDRGVIRETYLFDTEGDHTPGGVYLEQLALRVGGPHPGFDQTEAEYCAVVTPLLK